MGYALFVIAAFNVLGACITITKVGVARQPTTGGTAAITALLAGACITVEVLAGLALLHR